MKKTQPFLWIKSHFYKIIIIFLLIMILAFISAKKVHSPSESSEENVLADPITESRGL
ncbi:hypothetical protein HON22_00010 [Candidatus Peregrinibacteria bacterium]|jgi:hypothetical protein|nr:hypothetical protein [Candidatus Peregrinibacteria bacterium]